MSGPSSAQQQLSEEQAQFYQQGIQEASTTFSEQQGLIAQMKAVYDPILAAGPNQTGFSTAEENNLNAQAVEGTATNYAAGARAVGERQAAEGGGSTAAPTGAQEEMQQEVASRAAQQESSEESQIQQADYAAGHQNFQEATGALATVSGELNPTAYMNAATNAGSAAETTMNQMNEEENSWVAPVLGAVGAIGGGMATGGMSNLGKGAGFFG